MNHSNTKDIITIVVAILIALASLGTIGMLIIDSSTDAFIPQGDPVVKINEIIEGQFGSLDAINVGITVKDGTVFTKETLLLLESVTNQLEELDNVKQVISVTNSDHMSEGSDGFEVVSLYEGTKESEINALITRIDEWKDVYEGSLVSHDKKMVGIIVQPQKEATQQDLDDLLDDIQAILANYPSDDYHFSTIGFPSVKQQINRSLLKDIAILGPIVGLLIVIVLLFSFRRLAGIILPLAGLLISASITLGIMAILKITFTMATMLVPVLLLIVGSAYAIHVMSHFYAEMANFNSVVDQKKTAQIIDLVISRNKLPIIMAGATTAAGFVAQLTSPLGPFRTFGLLSAVGVVLSQVSSLYLLPAMLRLTYRKGFDPASFRVKKDENNKTKANIVFSVFEKWAIKGKIPMLIISAVLLVATIAVLPNIKVGTNMLEFFNKKSPLVVDTNLYNTHMAGSGILTVMIDSKESSAILEPAFLEKLEEFSNHISQKDKVGKVQSLIPYLKRMNYLMNKDSVPYREPLSEQDDFDFFASDFGFFDEVEEFDDFFIVEEDLDYDPLTYLEIPTDPAKYALSSTDEIKDLLAQYLLLYAGNLNLLIDDDVEPSSTLITIQLKSSEASYLREINNEINNYWEANLPANWSYMVGGGDAITLALTDLVTKSQIYSLVGALLIVWLLVGLIFKSPTAGLFGLIPVVFALMGIFLFMVILGIRLDIITSLLAALAIGVGVDYAIHFIAAFKRQEQANLGLEGISLTMNTTGKAIAINAASVIIGFSGLIFSRFIPIRQMGILFCVSMIFSSLASLTVLPMALIWLKPKFLKER